MNRDLEAAAEVLEEMSAEAEAQAMIGAEFKDDDHYGKWMQRTGSLKLGAFALREAAKLART